MSQNRITSIVLSGGKSSRMGEDKGLVIYHGKPLISYVLAKLSQQFTSLIISTNNREYAVLGYPIMEDIIPEIGPIGGIYSAMKQLKSNGYFFTACDIPNLTSDIILRMLTASENADVVFLKPKSGKPQPLPLYLGQKTFGIIESMIAKENYKLQNIIPVALENMQLIVDHVVLENELANINSPSDLE